MAYEHLALASDISKRLAANRATEELNWRGRPTVRAATGLRLDTGHGAAVASTAPRATATPAARSGAVAPATVSALALKLALQAERTRVATVFASAASHGRERVCATLLSSPKNWSASAIVAELPSMPNDATVAGRGGFAPARAKAPVASKPASTTSAGESWDRVWDRALGKEAAPATAASATWDRAYDRAFGKVQPSTASETTVWDKAIANLTPAGGLKPGA